ncbi:hypothetical protein TNCV_4326531 [Trichonephila clavipes]|nr:hypothetical protein TNCV_4326531 [Trichonephila clavipes]
MPDPTASTNLDLAVTSSEGSVKIIHHSKVVGYCPERVKLVSKGGRHNVKAASPPQKNHTPALSAGIKVNHPRLRDGCSGYSNDYATFDDGLPICATEIQEIVDLSEPMNNDSDAEIDNKTRIKTVTFANSTHCLEIVKTYLRQKDVNDAVFSSLHKIKKNTPSNQESNIY